MATPTTYDLLIAFRLRIKTSDEVKDKAQLIALLQETYFSAQSANLDMIVLDFEPTRFYVLAKIDSDVAPEVGEQP